ncbi:GTP cyclohydrolase FolE2 [Alteribacillus bidgolensis]|uniref:GTP cyclohydrolase FolE2 n=1 Tax=Alteribacillus bidgolensis TaxID=930129 RepID=A0A1G8CX91_9BACI|nr:GTP cyclohydrolase FolE2 [Alteribacillus bidgolensis]SDH50111.1 GTP cyclohydrolase I [Alteribacillus bidgolensis]
MALHLKKILPNKEERHKLFGSVPPIKGKKPTDKENMPDLQNKPNDYLFPIEKVGISNVRHPVNITSELDPGHQTTVAQFTLTTSLIQQSKGINMSRLTELLHEYHKKNWTLDLSSLSQFSKELVQWMEQDHAEVEVSFPWFFERKGPATGKGGLMHADMWMKSSYQEEEKKHSPSIGITAAVTTLCPCSKEISEYSAHNQRGMVTIKANLYEHVSFDWKKELLEAAETNASALLHPVLKRPDEKMVTEQAYENPRFVEDLCRLIAADLYEMDFIRSFQVECRNEESIHLHDAVAALSFSKEE